MRVPFKIYADFECILKKCDNVVGSCDNSWNVKESEHVPCGFGYKVVCVDDRFSKDVVVYRGKDCVKKLLLVFWMSMSIAKRFVGIILIKV